MRARWTRRMIGLLSARLPALALQRVADPRRRRRGHRRLETLLRAVLVGMVAGSKSLRELEALTEEMSVAARRKLKLPGRLPDTTMRDVLVRVSPAELAVVLRRQVRAAHRRGALAPSKLPWGVLSLDGKASTIRAWDDRYAQRQGKYGQLRTMTATLVSPEVRVCVGASPIPPSTNEMGHYQAFVEELLDAYASVDLFRVVMYDAGACSEANARWTQNKHLHYVMVLNEAQPTLYAEVRQSLGGRSADDADVVEDKGVRYLLWRTTELAGWLDWTHLKTVIRIQRQKLDARGRALQIGERYFVTSLRNEALDAGGWAALLRARWGVENNSHHLWDTVFAEDHKTWITADPRGALNILLLRRIAANMLALFRGRTLRGEFSRTTPWADLIRKAYNALIAATSAHLDGLRPRRPPPLIPA